MASQPGAVDLKANHDREIYGITITFMFLAAVATALRCFTVIRLRRQKPALDDFMVSIALIIALVEGIYVCVQTKPYGLGRHAASLRPEQLEAFQKGIYTVSLLHTCALALAKLAVLRLFYQIFTTRPFRLTIIFMGIVVILWWFGNFFAALLICIPVEYNWNQKIGGAHCGNHRLLLIITPIPWIVTDLTILILPIPMAWSLRMPRKQKIAVTGVFLLGGLSLISTVTRYTYVFYNSDDITWTTAPLTIWNVLEATITIIAACLIVMRPLFIRLFDNRSVLYRGRRNPRPKDNTDDALIDSAGGRFTHLQDPPSTKTQVNAERRWPGVGKHPDHPVSGSESDVEAMELHNSHVHVKNTVDVYRS